MLVTEKSNFTRGDKASVSVRLRSKKVVSEAANAKKRNRHSGDFSFFKHNHPAVHQNTAINNGFEDETDGKKEGGDWAYITFQNGVPTVQDIKTNVGPVSAKEPVGHHHVVVNGATPIPRPVKVINHMQPPPIWQPQNKRMSGDFSMFAHQATPMHYQQAPPITRQATPAALAMRQQQSPNRRSPKKTSPLATNNVQPRPNVMYRRRSDQNNGGHGGVALHGGVAKRCSGEFDFSQRQNRRSSSDYSLLMQSAVATPYERDEPKVATPPSVVRVQVNYPKNERPKSMIFNASTGSPDIVRGTPVKEDQPLPRPQGLGRRSVTQINIKRNSYSSAMCKSQENLVKVSTSFKILQFPNFLSRLLII